ncbi:Fucoxanthin-chlorophyll a-c binding protein F [Durusdinium trenchii]|uniref:Chloroplastic n=1 Tax=Durusdinium trenchii TaxID=1381693 RepID=A0ABP0ND66_9DINO
MEHFMNDETFFQHIDLHPHSNDVHVNEAVTGKRSNPLLTEVYTTAQNVSKAMPAEENQLDGEDLPPVKPQELWQMMAFSRKSSGLPLETVRERAKMLDDRSETGQKRPADVDIDQLRDQEQGHSSAAAASGSGAAHDTLLGERLTPTEIADELGRDDLHPLRKAYLLAEQDKRDPLEAMVPDHGTWHGKWTLPSRSEWQARQNLGLDWPTGDSTEAEVLAVQANRKEFRWKTMSETEKEAFKEAARQAWADGRSVWRTLEQGEDLREMAKRQALLPLTEFFAWATAQGAIGLDQVTLGQQRVKIAWLNKGGVFVRSLVAAKEVTVPILLPRSLLMFDASECDDSFWAPWIKILPSEEVLRDYHVAYAAWVAGMHEFGFWLRLCG